MKKLISSLIIYCCFMNLSSQEVAIQGGGSLNDWANLSNYAKSNKELIISILKPLEIGLDEKMFLKQLQTSMYAELDRII